MRDPLLVVTAPVGRAESGIRRVEIEAAYLEAAGVARTLPLLLSPADAPARREDLLDRADALLLTGGADVDPALYGQAPSGARDVDPRRDAVEIEALRRALERRIPVLAICRGCQLLNVALGGTLWQDLATERDGLDHDHWRDGDGDVHPVRADGTSRLRGVLREGEDVVQNSAHHQGIRELAPGLRAVAWASDGLVEAFEAVDAKGGWTVGVQWHPERKLADVSGTNRRLFERLGAEARRTASGREGDAS